MWLCGLKQEGDREKIPIPSRATSPQEQGNDLPNAKCAGHSAWLYWPPASVAVNKIFSMVFRFGFDRTGGAAVAWQRGLDDLGVWYLLPQ